MFKKILLIFLSILIIALTGCAAEPAETVEPETVTQEEAEPPAANTDIRLVFASGAKTGAYYPLAGVLSKVINDYAGYINFSVAETAGSLENIEQINQGLAQLAIAQTDTLDYAYHGTETWTKEPATNMRSLLNLYPEVCQIVVAADAEINTIADLAGKRVAVGEVGSGIEANAKHILAAYNLSFADLQIQQLGAEAAALALKDTAIDAFFITSAAPNAVLMNLQNEFNIKLIGLENEKIDTLVAEYPFYSRASLGNADYGFLAADIQGIAVQAGLICAPDLPDQVAYDIVKAIIEGQSQITESHAKGAFINQNNAISGLSLDLHPGARLYFEEIGVL